MNINKIIIRNANLSSNYENFAENFVSMIMLLLLNFYADYNQMKLNKVSKNMIVFQIFFKLLKMIIILMKITNSIKQFV